VGEDVNIQQEFWLIMKLVFISLTKALIFVLSAVLIGGENAANAGQFQAQRLSHDLVQPNSQDFFTRGQSRLDTEI